MFEQQFYRCPRCSTEIHQAIEDSPDTQCLSCGRRFAIIRNEDTGKTGLIELENREIPEPLFMPRGSIRALVTIIIAFASWILIFTGRNIPGYVLNLLLAMTGHYFAFRKLMRAAQSRIWDASPTIREPLSLPSGFIRLVLIVGFTVCAVALYHSKRLLQLEYLEFFSILFGLVAGYIFSKMVSTKEGHSFLIWLNHVKGVIVICASVCLCWVLLSRTEPDTAYFPLVLSCFISFYFGSR